MPMKPRRRCSHPRCPMPCIDGAAYCADHKRASHRAYDRARGTPTRRGYGAEWRGIRDRVLQARPRCELCGDKATCVHHTLPLAEHGSHAVPLQALCKACHMRVHPEKGRRGGGGTL